MANTSPHNWAAAYTAYCQNHPLEEIADALGIPLERLKARASNERWAGLRAELPLVTNADIPISVAPSAPASLLAPANPFAQGRGSSVVPVEEGQPKLPVALQAKLAQLAENRRKNFDDAAQLRQHAGELIEHLVTGKLEMEQLYHFQGTVVRTKRSLTPADLVNIATYLRLIQEMTYRALGDNAAGEGKGSDSPAGANSGATNQIIINLPNAIAQPRQNRAAIEKAGGKVIDVDTVSVRAEPAPGDRSGMHEVTDEVAEEAQEPDGTEPSGAPESETSS